MKSSDSSRSFRCERVRSGTCDNSRKGFVCDNRAAASRPDKTRFPTLDVLVEDPRASTGRPFMNEVNKYVCKVGIHWINTKDVGYEWIMI